VEIFAAVLPMLRQHRRTSGSTSQSCSPAAVWLCSEARRNSFAVARAEVRSELVSGDHIAVREDCIRGRPRGGD
jgi:hypothetical protein